MTENQRCIISEACVSGIKAVYLENSFLRVGILVGKGTDIFEFIYKPINMEFMLKTSEGLKCLEGRDYAVNRLKHYSEVYAGGWQDILPNRACWANGEVGQGEEGESVGLPWEYEVLKNTDEVISVKCTVKLSVTTFYIEKIFTLKQKEPTIFIEEKIRNYGHETVKFTWTQHPAFGGNFLDENVQVYLPGCKAFNVSLYEQDKDRGIEPFEESVEHISLPSGKSYNLLKVLPKGKGEGCYVTMRKLWHPAAGLYHPWRGIGICLNWDSKAFPYLRYWAGNNGRIYTVALEPSSSYFSQMHDSVKYGVHHELKPGATMEAWVECRVVKDMNDYFAK